MTYLDSLFGALTADPDRVAIVDGDTGVQITAAVFTDRVARLARGLTKLVSAHDVVALVAPVTVDGLAVRYAAALLGCTTVYCPDAGAPQRLSRFLAQIDADLTVVFPETAAAIDGPRVVPVEALLHSDGTGSTPLPHVDVAPSDLCVLVATGGTTGISKASERDWRSYAELVDDGPTPGRRQLICTPLAYVAQTVADSVLIGGGMLVLHRTLEPRQSCGPSPSAVSPTPRWWNPCWSTCSTARQWPPAISPRCRRSAMSALTRPPVCGRGCWPASGAPHW